jgi:two-component system response regulator YesN
MYSLLLVEDEQLIRKELLMSVDWERAGCRVTAEAADGITGEQLIRKLNPDIVLTDIRLPGQDGLTMLEHAPPRSAIIITGFGEFELAQHAIRLGVYDFLLKPIEQQILVAALTRLTQRLALQEETANAADPHGATQEIHVRSAMDYIDSHFNEDISITHLSEMLGISESHLSHLFREHSGFTIVAYLQDRRMREAIKLLQDPSLNVTDIYTSCGFTNGSYFCKMFRRYTGVTPSEFRNSH